MSSTKSVQLTKEEEEYLKALEEEFKDRYTENDEEFQAVLKAKLPLPPIMEDWRDFRFNRDGYRGDDSRYSHSSRHDYRHRERTRASMYRPY